MTGWPAGWIKTRLGEVADWGSGGTPKADVADYYGGSIPWAVIGDLNDGSVGATARAITDAGLSNSSAKMVDDHTVLVAMYGSIGKLGLPTIPMATNQAIAFARPRCGVVNRLYLFYYLMHARGALMTAGKGAAQRNISQTVLKAWPIPLAPPAEQERIVVTIEEQFSWLDVGVVALERTRGNLDRMRSSVLMRAIQGWSEIPLGDIAQVFVGATPSRSKLEFWGGSIPWVSSGEVAFCRIRQTREKITEKGLGNSTRLHPAGTVLLAMIGEGKTRGQAAILDVPAAHNQNSAAIRLDKNRCLPEWLFYVLMARYEETRQVSSGGNQLALNGTRVRALAVPLPSLDEQYQLVRDLERQLSLIDRLTADVDDVRPRNTVLRASILERAFSGRLVPQDSRDEPASVLLERMTAECASSNGHMPAEAPRERRRKATA